MSNMSISEQVAGRGPFGVFPIDRFGTIGDLFGVWHHTLAQAEQYLVWVTEHYGKNFTALSKVEHDTRRTAQQAAGLAFKTGHDLLMDEFDQWLRDNHLVRGTEAAARLGLSDTEFKTVLKRGWVKRQYMPDHDNLAGFPADVKLTNEQQQKFLNELTLSGHQVAQGLGVTPKEFSEIRRQSKIAHSTECLGRTIPNESATASLYSRADIEKLRPAGEAAIANRSKSEARPQK